MPPQGKLAMNCLGRSFQWGAATDWTRICVGAALCITLSGCVLLYEHAPLIVDMHRVSDGAKTVCMTGVYNLLFGEREARRDLNACILACRKLGFVENGEATQIDESVSPTVCQRWRE